MPLATVNEPTVVDALRGDRVSRPPTDRWTASGLRAQIDDGLFAIFGDDADGSVVTISPKDFRDHQDAVASSELALARGVLVSYVLRLVVAGVGLDDPYEDALAAWRSTDPSRVDAVCATLDRDDLARLATDVRAHSATLLKTLGPINPLWRPRTALRVVQRLHGGRVICRDVVDLVVGSVGTERASVAIVDVTTSALGPTHERLMRYHALLHTLRTSVVPLRVAALSTATGEMWHHDVDNDTLQRGVADLLEILRSRPSQEAA